jgi:hypothetical protein
MSAADVGVEYLEMLFATLIDIKGTGEASPVRGRDWAGFKFAAK